jgi:ribonuclease BN (tRNA processing enzyme)
MMALNSPDRSVTAASRQLLSFAAEAQVGRLVLVHLSSFRPEHGEPVLDRAYPIFPRTELAFDRMEIEF